MKEIKHSKVLCIKLGRKGRWAEECIEKDQSLKLGYSAEDHLLCLKGKWDALYDYEIANDVKPGKASWHVNQIKEFYEADESVLWITFFKGSL